MRRCLEPIEMSDLQQSYDQIIRPIEDRMIRSIWRIVRNPQDAEDAMQDALLTILKRWDRICGHQNPQALVLKICIDAAYHVTRRTIRNQRAVPFSEAAGEQASSSRSPPEELMRTEEYFEIIKAIHRLPRQQANAMLMHAVQGQRYDEIAATLGCTEATVRKHVARSRQRLRVWLAHLELKKLGRG
jgi:RNA polymerase sigma-70 factor (ECF subfamily)